MRATEPEERSRHIRALRELIVWAITTQSPVAMLVAYEAMEAHGLRDSEVVGQG